MTPTRSPKVEVIFWLLPTVLGYFLLASLSLHATKGADHIAAIWPPSGYLLGLLLLMPARAWPASLAGAALASLAANWLNGVPIATAAAFSAANAAEAAFALWLLRRGEPGELSFMAPRSVTNFCIAVIAASVASALLAAALTGRGVDFILSWTTTVALGMLIVTPPIVILTRMIESKALDNTPGMMKLEAAAMLTAAAAVTAVSFSQAHFPATFLPCVAVIAAAYRLGPFGAASGTLIVSIIATLLTSRGLGPIAAIEDSEKAQVLFLQFYLLTLLFTSLPLAALLVVRQRLAARLEQSNRWLLQAEAAALVGHWRVDLVRWTIHWSDQAYRVHGIEPGTPVEVTTSLEHYVPEDRVRVNEALARAVRTGEPFELMGRIVRSDGAIRHIKSYGSIEKNRQGRSIAIFGTVQDMTRTVEDALILEAARNSAEEAANTDMLTGLPNRRCTLVALEQALARARDDDVPLAVAIFDIDHFKQINDGYGHAMGDRVIRQVAQQARAALGGEDVVGRFGGEEFVCIFCGPSARSAATIAECVRKAIEKGDSAPGGPPKVTISVGLAIYAGETGIEDLLHRADKALYLAKREGRNRLRLAA